MSFNLYCENAKSHPIFESFWRLMINILCPIERQIVLGWSNWTFFCSCDPFADMPQNIYKWIPITQLWDIHITTIINYRYICIYIYIYTCIHTLKKSKFDLPWMIRLRWSMVDHLPQIRYDRSSRRDHLAWIISVDDLA